MAPAKIGTGRLEAFSDGVIAVIVTIMVLELHAPAQPTMAALWKIAPTFLSYGLSFIVIAIMWVNHHHIIHAIHGVTPWLLWSNLNLLFWMSLIPFVTDFLGKNHREPFAIALYAFNLTLCAASFGLLRIALSRQDRENDELSRYHAHVQQKNFVSGALYLLAAPLAYKSIYFSYAIFILVPAMYFLPEKKLAASRE